MPFDVTLTSDVLAQFSFAKFAGTYTEDDGTFFISVARMREGDVVKANTPYLVQAKTAGAEAQVPTDYRRTLYWNPNLKLDAEGRARVTLYNNSRTTQIQVEAAGQAADGTLLWNR